MSYVGATIPLPGLVNAYISTTGQEVKTFSVENVLTELLFRVTHAPSGGDLVLELNTLQDGTGTAVQLTIADGTTYVATTGLSVAVGALYQFVVSEGGTGTAMNLSGEYTLNTVTGVTDYFTTLTNVKNYLKIGTTDAARDTVLNSIIAGVTSAMQDYMGRKIVQGTATSEAIDGWYTSEIYTEHAPIRSITSVTENDTALVESTDFESLGSDKERGKIVRISGGDPIAWARGRRSIKVTYDHGYIAVPDSLVRIATMLVAAKFNETTQGKGWLGLLSKGVAPNDATTYDKDIWAREAIPAMKPFRKQVA